VNPSPVQAARNRVISKRFKHCHRIARSVPQGLKPRSCQAVYGTTEVVPFHKAQIGRYSQTQVTNRQILPNTRHKSGRYSQKTDQCVDHVPGLKCKATAWLDDRNMDDDLCGGYHQAPDDGSHICSSSYACLDYWDGGRSGNELMRLSQPLMNMGYLSARAW
jgi:hypothetical protein